MSRRLPPIYTDEDINGKIVEALRQLGHDVQRAIDRFPHHTDDYVHLDEATKQRRVLVTHNHDDFLLLHKALRYWQVPRGVPGAILHTGVLTVPHINSMDAEQIAWEISEQVGSDVTDKFYRLVEKNGQPLWFDETMLGSRQPLP